MVHARLGRYWLAGVLGLLAVSGCLDLVQATLPQADADTLAYHLQLPKEWLEHGLRFTPRAIDGAGPFLTHMTYALALRFGETAASLWFVVLSWGTCLVVFGAAKNYNLPTDISLGLVAVWKTIPAVIYGAGNGQVEVKIAAFAIVAALMTADAIRRDDWRLASIAGLAAGLFLSSKYTGALLAVGCFAAFLLRGRTVLACWFYLGCLVAGTQWLAFNYWNTGDPVWPLLTWTGEAKAALDAWSAAEAPAPRTIWLFLTYPIQATFNGLPEWESGRTGFGLFPLLILPLSLWGMWKSRKQAISHPLVIAALIVAVFYLLWFSCGPAQRVRHYLPVLPLVLLLLALAAWRYRGFKTAIALTLAIQVGGMAIFHVKHIRGLFESRDEYLARNVAYYAPVPYLNELKPAKLLHDQRQLMYLIDAEQWFSNGVYDTTINLRPSATPDGFRREVTAIHATHILAMDGGRLHKLTSESECATPLRQFSATHRISRTVDLGTNHSSLTLFRWECGTQRTTTIRRGATG